MGNQPAKCDTELQQILDRLDLSHYEAELNQAGFVDLNVMIRYFVRNQGIFEQDLLTVVGMTPEHSKQLLRELNRRLASKSGSASVGEMKETRNESHRRLASESGSASSAGETKETTRNESHELLLYECLEPAHHDLDANLPMATNVTLLQ